LLYGYGNPGRQDDGLGPLFIQRIEKRLTDEQIERLKIAANQQDLTDDELKRISDSNNEFYAMHVLDKNGKIIHSSDLTRIGLDRSDDEYFIEGFIPFTQQKLICDPE